MHICIAKGLGGGGGGYLGEELQVRHFFIPFKGKHGLISMDKKQLKNVHMFKRFTV